MRPLHNYENRAHLSGRHLPAERTQPIERAGAELDRLVGALRDFLQDGVAVGKRQQHVEERRRQGQARAAAQVRGPAL